jgi:uncharacterized membrane protein YeiH
VYFILSTRTAKCSTHVLFVNTSFSHLHSFCATGMSSGLATDSSVTGEFGRVCCWGVGGGFVSDVTVRECFGVAFYVVRPVSWHKC